MKRLHVGNVLLLVGLASALLLEALHGHHSAAPTVAACVVCAVASQPNTVPESPSLPGEEPRFEARVHIPVPACAPRVHGGRQVSGPRAPPSSLLPATR